jgi:hypothetical protein
VLKILANHRIQLILFVFFFTASCDRCFAQNDAQPPEQQPPQSIQSELDAMRKRIDELEAELKNVKASERPTTPPTSAKATVPVALVVAAPATTTPEAASLEKAATQAAAEPIAPFSDADWTWLNGNPRTKEIFWDTKFFTPEIRSDTVYVFDFNRPTDHSMGGSDLTGVFCTSGSEREFTLEGSWYADEEIQAGTDRDVVAAG